MKNFILLKLILCYSLLHATDRYVDTNLTEGNGTTLFPTLTEAINASQDGDRIILPQGTYEETNQISLNKSLTFLPLDEGGVVTFNFHLNLDGAENRKYQFFGIQMNDYDIYTNSFSWDANVESRCKLILIKCDVDDIVIDDDGWDVNVIHSTIDYLEYQFGNVVKSTLNYLSIRESSGNSLEQHTNTVVQNDIHIFHTTNNDQYLLVANNHIDRMRLMGWKTDLTKHNLFVNNDFGDNDFYLVMPRNVGTYNVDFSNNKFIGDLYTCDRSDGNYDYQATCHDCFSECGTGCNLYFRFNSNGYFRWTYNTHGFPGASGESNYETECQSQPGEGDNLDFVKTDAVGSGADTGSPEHKYYDVSDLTRNDVGRAGGPWGYANFPDGIVNDQGQISKAFLFDLEMKTDIYPGDQIDIKGKAYHLH